MIVHVFQGIQRPLEDICTLTESIYIPKGVNTPALDRSKKWEFEPYGRIRVRTEYMYMTIVMYLYIVSLALVVF